MPYVLICTGSRDLGKAGFVAVEHVLDTELLAHPDLYIRVGDCETGLDARVRNWARATWGVLAWRQRCRVYWRDFACYGGSAAGPKRNEAMVADGADRCAAWFEPPPALNRGTANCVKLARRAGIEVVRYGWTPAEQPEQETLL